MQRVICVVLLTVWIAVFDGMPLPLTTIPAASAGLGAVGKFRTVLPVNEPVGVVSMLPTGPNVSVLPLPVLPQKVSRGSRTGYGTIAHSVRRW